MLLGCSNSGTIEVPGDLDPLGDDDCAIDPSLDDDSAYDLTLGGEVTEHLCPRRDEDYWQFFTAAPAQRLDVEVVYDKLANMQLTVDLRGPVGACLPQSPSACALPADCGDGETCDTLRGGCRRVAANEACIVDGDCESGERCVAAHLLIATLGEATAAGSTHRLKTSLPAAMPGRYVLTVRDGVEQTADAVEPYRLAVTAAADPDAHEVNDTKNLATELTSGGEITAYLSHRGRGLDVVTARQSDIDWYTATPAAGRQPVVIVDLRWPDAAAVDPTFTLLQGTWEYPSSEVQTLGSGTTATRRRVLALVPPGDEPVYVRVENTTATFDAEIPYTLTLTLAEDTSEPSRDDAPGSAVQVSLAAPSASHSAQSFVGRLVAQNDDDWYRFDKGTSDNSLLHVTLSAALDAHFLLQATFYAPTTQGCASDGDCGTSRRCVAGAGTCVEPWLQRPSPDGPGDAQAGGLSPNYIETQLPLLHSGPGALYLLVGHTDSTFLAYDGHSLSDDYTLVVRHKLEPDDEDRTNPDNRFDARPLMNGKGRGDFFAHARSVTSVQSSGGTGGVAFARFAPGSVALAGQCSTVTVEAYDDMGAPADRTVDLPAGFTTDCVGGLATTTLAVTGGSGTVGYTGPASLTNLASLGVGGVSAAHALPVASGASPGTLAMVGEGGAAPTLLAVGVASGVVRVTLPAAASTARSVSLLAQNATVACTSTGQASTCPGAADVVNPCPPTRTGAGSKSNCQVSIAAGEGGYDLYLTPIATGLVTLRASDDAGTYGAASTAATAITARVVSTSAAVRGYISYEGDNDFFTIPIAGLPASGLTVWLNMPASAVDIRMVATRGWTGGGLEASDADDDACPTGSCAGGGACSATRRVCSQPAYAGAVGPAVGNCLFLTNGTAPELIVWVNEANANDWDEAQPYEFEVELSEGCPSTCPSNYCGG